MERAGSKAAWSTAAVALAALAAACGGGGDAPPAPPPQDAVSGIWVGTATGYGDAAIAIVDGTDITVFRPDGWGVLHGALSSRDGVIDARVSYLIRYAPPLGGSNGYPMTLSGRVTPGRAISASGTDSRTPSATVTLSLRYDAGRHERPASLARIAGTWRDGVAGSTSFVEWRIDAASGALSGSDSNGCSYAGRVTVPDPTRNLYRIRYDRYVAGTSSGYEPTCYGGRGIETRAFLDDGAAREDTLRSAGLAPGSLFVKGDAEVENLVRR